MSASPQRSDWNDDLAREIIAPHLHEPGGLLPALHAIQHAFGFIPKPAMPMLAHAFNITRAEVFGVASFYHDFRLDGPAGRHVLKLCRAEACQAVGAEKIAERAKAHLKMSWHETTSDGEWTLEPVFCLGLCASGPAALVDGEPVGGIDEAKLDGLLGIAAP